MKNKNTIDINYSMETRVALLEQSMVHIHDSLRDIKDCIIKLDNKFETRFNNIDAKFDSKFAAVDTKFNLIDAKIDKHFQWNIGLIFGMYAFALTTLLGAIGKSHGWF